MKLICLEFGKKSLILLYFSCTTACFAITVHLLLSLHTYNKNICFSCYEIIFRVD